MQAVLWFDDHVNKAVRVLTVVCCHLHAWVCIAVTFLTQGGRQPSASILVGSSLSDDAHSTQLLQDASFSILIVD